MSRVDYGPNYNIECSLDRIEALLVEILAALNVLAGPPEEDGDPK